MSQTALITGPARGIGAAVARRLAARGFRLALIGLEPGKLSALAQELGPQHFWSECDVTDIDALERCVSAAVNTLGRLDVVVANAGIATHGSVAVTPMRDLKRLIDVNLTGVVGTVSATLPHIVASRGYFLLISSAAALVAPPGLATYAATKAGVEHFGNALRLELAHQGVDVGVAHPCWIDTDMVRDPRNELASFGAMLKALPGPFGVVTSVEECANALADAIARRKRKVFIPRGLAPFSALRQLLMSRFGEFQQRRDAAKLLPRMEEEVRRLGRSYGENSVEMKRGG